MSGRVEELAARREHLLARSQELRERVALHGRDIEQAVNRIEGAIDSVRSVVTPPLLLTALAGLLIVVKPRRLLGFAVRGVMFAATARRVVGFLLRRKQPGSWLSLFGG